MEKAYRTEELVHELSDADADVNDTNKSPHLPRKVRQEEKMRFQYAGENGRKYSSEPRRSSSYTPIPEMMKYEYIFVGGPVLEGIIII